MTVLAVAMVGLPPRLDLCVCACERVKVSDCETQCVCSFVFFCHSGFACLLHGGTVSFVLFCEGMKMLKETTRLFV